MYAGSNIYQPWRNKRGELKLAQFEVKQAEWAELYFINLTSYWATNLEKDSQNGLPSQKW